MIGSDWGKSKIDKGEKRVGWSGCSRDWAIHRAFLGLSGGKDAGAFEGRVDKLSGCKRRFCLLGGVCVIGTRIAVCLAV